jgi:hypothetical protein
MKNRAKRIILALVSALLLSALAIMLGACSKGEELVSDGSAFKDKRTKVTYTYAPFSYEPIAMGDEVYGQSEYSKFYEIVGLDPLEYICEESGTVFYDKSITLPTPDKMSFEYLEICTEEETLTVEKTVTDTEAIKFIINDHLSATKLTYSPTEASAVYKLRFADTSMGLYYSVELIRYGEDIIEGGTNYGRDFIYDRSMRRFTKAPDALLAMIDG